MLIFAFVFLGVVCALLFMRLLPLIAVIAVCVWITTSLNIDVTTIPDWVSWSVIGVFAFLYFIVKAHSLTRRNGPQI
jgi:hypothetical protein